MGTSREWCELYTFFRLLADGQIAMGTEQGSPGEQIRPLASILRTEHDGIRKYLIESQHIRIVSDEQPVRFVPREDFSAAADLILQAVKSSTQDEVEVPEGVEAFLDELRIFDLEAPTTDRTDLHLTFWHPDSPPCGFIVRSRLGQMRPLLDGGRTANLKLEQSGIKFASPTVSKINASPESANEVAERMLLIERLGGVLRYADVADKVFKANLSMIDLHFPRLLAEMVRTMHLDGISRTCDLVDVMEQINPLKIKEELIQKHLFYRFKTQQFLTALLCGMRPAKIYRGETTAIEGLLLLDGSGQVAAYHLSDRSTLENFLLKNTRFEKGALEKDKYGYLERENGVYYFKLNAKIGFCKR